MYTIIEDCSPFYIRFTYPGIEKLINKCKEIVQSNEYTLFFTHHRQDILVGIDILNMCPIAQELQLQKERVSLFVTQPGYYHRPHKDGYNHRISINFTITISDKNCVTSWYSDEDLKDYPMDDVMFNFLKNSREVVGFDKTKHTPLKSTTFKEGECILFNTDIFHDFDNSKSNNQRVILTLRAENPENIYFDDVRKLLFDKK